MSTRGTISIENQDGSISSVYSHWDNYLENNGKILFEHYSDTESVQSLIDGGNISSLGEYVSEVTKPFEREDNGDFYTTFYSYRGEPSCQATVYESFDEFETGGLREKYNYLFHPEQGIWSVYFDGDWHDLEEELVNKNIITE